MKDNLPPPLTSPPSRQARGTREGGIVILSLIALSLVGLHPFTYTSLATSFDGLLHLYRLVELDHLISQGVLFPRWAPDFVFGFGYPIFNFYAPLAYYLSAPLHWLGLTFADSATLLFISCTLAAELAIFALARDLCDGDKHAGIVATTAYAYAPTHIYDNFYRSAWGTVLAYALAPFALWALLRWKQTARAEHLISLAVSVAALMLAHNVSALLTMPVLVVAVLVLPPFRGTQVHGHTGTQIHREKPNLFPGFPVSLFPCVPPYLALTLGLALSAFFWLPALVETQYIQTWRLTIPPDFDFHTHFLSVRDWFAWPAPAVIGLVNPDLVNTVGPVQMVLAIGGTIATVGIAIARRTANDRRRPALGLLPAALFAIVLVASLFMTLPQSAWLWERVPLLASLQFPHRFLSVTALCAAVLSAQLIHVVSQRWRVIVSLTACALLVVTAMSLLYPRLQPAINPNPTLADALAHEHNSGALGTTASGEYFPTWVQFVPKSSPFEEAIVVGENPQRFESRSLPPGAKVSASQTGPTAFALSVDSPGAFKATFRHFYFPGWQGFVDDHPVATTPSTGQGLSTFDVPAGQHRIALVFESTPIHNVATLVSVITAIVGIALIMYRVSHIATRHSSFVARRSPLAIRPLPYIAVGLALLLFKLVVADRADTPLRVAFDGERVPTVQYARSIALGNAVTWLGYDLAGDGAQSEQVLALTLYWGAQRELDTVYSSFAHVVDERANLYAQKDNLHPGGAPTTTWRAREYDVDRHSIEIPAGTPPGEYWIEVGLYDPHSGVRLLRESAPPSEPLDRILIGPIRVRKAAQPPSLAALSLQRPLDYAWPSGLRLLGSNAERDQLPADDFLRVALYWRADMAQTTASRMTLRLLDAQSHEVAAQSGEPSNDRYPTTEWSVGEFVRDNRALWIPRTLPKGEYRLQLRLDGDERWLDLGVFRR